MKEKEKSTNNNLNNEDSIDAKEELKNESNMSNDISKQIENDLNEIESEISKEIFKTDSSIEEIDEEDNIEIVIKDKDEVVDEIKSTSNDDILDNDSDNIEIVIEDKDEDVSKKQTASNNDDLDDDSDNIEIIIEDKEEVINESKSNVVDLKDDIQNLDEDNIEIVLTNENDTTNESVSSLEDDAQDLDDEFIMAKKIKKDIDTIEEDKVFESNVVEEKDINVKKKGFFTHLFYTNTNKGEDKFIKFFDLFLKLSFALVIVILAVTIRVMSTGVDFDKSKMSLPTDSIVYDKNNVEIGKISRKQANQEQVTYDNLNQTLINTLVATEDSTYFSHNGFDVLNTIESGFKTKIIKNSTSGGSSITQQIVGGSHYNRLSDASIARKIREIAMSVYAENHMSKTEIITDYLNFFHFGQDNIHGVQTASKYYFSKNANALNMLESSILVGTLNAPNLYNPLSGVTEDGVYAPSKRLSDVLYSNYNQGYLCEAEYTLLEQVPIENTVKITEVKKTQKYQAYLDVVISELKNDYKVDPFVTPLKIYTNMDIELQDYANEINKGKVVTIPDQDLSYGFILTKTQTGEISAIGGGPQYNDGGAMLFNNAIDTEVQPGSSFKPIIDYGAAFEYLHYPSNQTISNAPYKDPYSSHVFQNHDKKSGGYYTIDSALATSRNLTALRTFTAVRNQIGDQEYINYLGRLGFDFEPTDIVTSAALGTKEVSPLQMAGAYQAFGNGGYYIKPHTIANFEDLEGNKTENMFKKEQAIDKRTAFMMSAALEKSTLAKGTYVSSASYYKTPYAAKTGTSNWGPEGAKYGIADGAQKDAWFVGYTSEYTMASWAAMNSEATEKGKIIQWGAEHDFPAYIWGAMMNKAATGNEYSYLYGTPPEGISGGPSKYYYTE